jgi:hypothetical protein
VTTDEFLDLEPTFAGDRDFFVHVLPTLNTIRKGRSGRSETD